MPSLPFDAFNAVSAFTAFNAVARVRPGHAVDVGQSQCGHLIDEPGTPRQ